MQAPPAPNRPPAGPPRWRWLEAPALAGLGALQTAAFVLTALWWLPLLSMAVLVWRLDAAPGPRRAAWLGWCFGFAWLAAGTWWLFVSMHRYGHLPAWLAASAVAALAALLSLYLAAAAAAWRRWRRGGHADALLFAACWLLAELARGTLFTGFPWVSSGYAQVDGPLAALAPWVGVYGIGAVAAALAAVLAGAVTQAGRARWAGPALAAAVLAALAVAGPGDHTQPGRTLTVQLLQPNVAQDEKFAADRMPATLQWVAARLLAARADLVVAPETAVPLLPAQLEDFAPGYWAGLRQRFASGPQAALIGVPLGDYDRGYTNSVAGLSAATAARPGGDYRYDKHHLVPFGEYIPFGETLSRLGLRGFAVREGLRADDPMAGIESPRLPRSLPKSLSEADVESLLAAPEDRLAAPQLAALAGGGQQRVLGLRELPGQQRLAHRRTEHRHIVLGHGTRSRSPHHVQPPDHGLREGS